MGDLQKEQAPADANIGWQQFEAQNGMKYEVRAEKYDLAKKPAPDSDEPSARGPSFSDFAVNWAPHTSGDTDTNTRNTTAITWYNLDKAPWYRPYKWRLTVNVNDTYNYTFRDQTNDTYDLSTWQLGAHTVDFNSDSPTIVSVSGN